LYSSSRVDGRGGGGMVIAGARRDAGGLVRAAPGRELPRRLADGRVLALAAVRGLAEPPFLPAPFLRAPFLPAPFLAVPDLVALRDSVMPPFGLVAAALAVLDLAEDADCARDLVPDGLLVLPLAAVPRDAARAGDLAVGDLLVADLLVAGLLAAGLRAVLARLAAGRRAGAADVAGLAADSEFAAVVRALAAVDIALVAVFMDCIAVDSVRADDVALVAAAVILVAAEVTLVAADETVRAALAGVWPADEARVVARAGWRVALVLRAVLRGLAVRADLVVL
jgi:hypothetical protein